MMNKEELIELRDNVQAIIDGKDMEFYSPQNSKWFPFVYSQMIDLLHLKLRVKPEPRVIYVNEYDVDDDIIHDAKEDAIRNAGKSVTRVAVKYQEVIE